MPTSCAARCPESVDATIDGFGLAIIALLVALFLGRWWFTRHRLWIPASHPLMREAQRKALASLDVLRAEHDPSRHAARVKIRIDTDGERAEVAWAELLTLGADVFTARIAMAPNLPRVASAPEVTLPLDRLLDWLLLRADGTIRGGYTRQAEIRLRRQAGKRLPTELAEMSGRFVDVA